MATNFIHPGRNISASFTNAVNSGELVMVGSLAAVALVDIPANGYGALSVSGVFALPKATGALAQGSKVYADTTGKVTVTATDNDFIGFVTAPATADATVAEVLLNGIPA